MSVNDEILYAGSDSFWDVGGYKDTVKRCEDGLSLTQKLSALVQERADIEKHYATELKEWSKKWNKFLETGIIKIYSSYFISLSFPASCKWFSMYLYITVLCF